MVQFEFYLIRRFTRRGVDVLFIVILFYIDVIIIYFLPQKTNGIKYLTIKL